MTATFLLFITFFDTINYFPWKQTGNEVSLGVMLTFPSPPTLPESSPYSA